MWQPGWEWSLRKNGYMYMYGLVPLLSTWNYHYTVNQPWCYSIIVLITQSCLTFATLWTVAPKAPLSMEFSRQEFWSGLPFPSPRDLPDPGTKPKSPALAGRFFTVWDTREVLITYIQYKKKFFINFLFEFRRRMEIPSLKDNSRRFMWIQKCQLYVHKHWSNDPKC